MYTKESDFHKKREITMTAIIHQLPDLDADELQKVADFIVRLRVNQPN